MSVSEWETGETVGDVGRVSQRSAHRRFVWSSMEVSSVYITPKRKSRNLATSSSSEESSPEGKKLRHSYSRDSKNSDDKDQSTECNFEGGHERSLS